MMNKLIITADDFGMCEEVNDAILECISAGNIKSTNVMANMDHAYDERLLENRDNVTIGLHWNLTTGRPVLRPELVPSLVGANGEFLDSQVFRTAIKKRHVNKSEVRQELIAQYNRFVFLYGKPDYWTSHENIHTNIRLFRLFSDLAMELGIFRMRCHNRIYLKGRESVKSDEGLKEVVKKYIFRHWYGKALRKGMLMPAGIIYFTIPEDRYSFAQTSGDIAWSDGQVIEMYVHPSKTAYNVFFGAVTDDRVKDYELCRDHKLIRLLKDSNIEVADYGSLEGSYKL